MAGSAGIAGITVGHGNIIVTPQLHNNFQQQLQGQLNPALNNAGHQGSTQLASGLSAGTGGLRAQFGAIGRGLGGALAVGVAGAAAVGITSILTTGLDEVKDYEKGLAQLEVGLKSTGNVAGITVGEMEDLASSIEAYSGQTDDSIVATEQLLLTFTNIRNEAGAGNDVFSQTTKIAADMAARLGGEASDSAVQLGKALNDPVKGVTALTKVGVSFTSGQKESIKSMVAAGDTMGAQKIILAELNKEFGGSAAAVGDTLPGKIERGKRAFEGMAQSLVTLVAPALSTLVEGGTKAIQFVGPQIEKGIGVVVTAVKPILSEIGGGVRAFFAAFKAGGDDVTSSGIAGVFERIGLVARKVFDGLAPVVGRIAGIVRTTVLPAFQRVGTVLAANLLPIVSRVGTFLTGTLLPAFLRVVNLVVTNAVPVFVRLGEVFTTRVIPAVRVMAEFFVQRVLPVVVRMYETIYSNLIPAFAKVARVVIDVVGSAFRSVTKLLAEHGDQIMSVVRFLGTFVGAIAVVVGWIVGRLAPVLGVILKVAFDIVVTAVGTVIDIFAGLADSAMWLWHTILEPAFTGIGAAWGFTMGAFRTIYDTVIAPIWGFFKDGINGVGTAVGFVVSAIGTVWGGLGSVLSWPINNVLAPIVRGVATVIDKVLGFVANKTPLAGWENWQGVATGGGGANTGAIAERGMRFKVGGVVPGGYGGGDIVDASLEPGEVVVRKERVRAEGGPEAFHNRMNRTPIGRGIGGPVDNPLVGATGTIRGGGLGLLKDAASFVVDKAKGWVRRGAAAAFDLAYGNIAKPLLGRLPDTGWASVVPGTVDTMQKAVSDWLRGREHDDPIAYAGELGGATGLIAQYMQRSGIPFRINSVFRAGAGFHGTHNAIDFGGNLPAIGNYWADVGGSLLELIYGDGFGRNYKNGVNVGDGMGTYGAATMAQHGGGNAHVHVAATTTALERLLSAEGGGALGGVFAPRVFDRGGVLAPGMSGINLSRRPEAVLDPDESAGLKAMLRGGGGNRPGLFAGANVTIGDRADLEGYAAQADWLNRRGRL